MRSINQRYRDAIQYADEERLKGREITVSAFKWRDTQAYFEVHMPGIKIECYDDFVIKQKGEVNDCLE